MYDFKEISSLKEINIKELCFFIDDLLDCVQNRPVDMRFLFTVGDAHTDIK